MTRYNKHKEPLEVRQYMHFYDQYGNLLHNVIELDPQQDNGEPNGKRINDITGEVEPCYYKYSSAVVDGVVDPPEEHMEAFRKLHKLKHFSLMPQQDRHVLVKSLITALKTQENVLDKKEPFIVATCPHCHTTFNVEPTTTE